MTNAISGCLCGARKCIVCRFGILAHPVTASQLRDADESWMSRGASCRSGGNLSSLKAAAPTRWN
jgi:hypothetical protein